MNILHVIFSMTIGGSETMLVDILNKQATYSKAKIGLLIINNKFDKSVLTNIDDRVKVILNNREVGSRNLWSIIRLNFHIVKFKADFIHIHDSNAINLIFQPKRKKLLTIHEIKARNRYWDDCGTLCAISNIVKEKIFASKGIESVLVYNGVDADRICIKDTSLYSINRKYRLIQISRLDHKIKGQDILIKAFALLKKKHPNLELYLDFIGEGTSMQYLQSLVNELALENSIRFLGLKDRNYIYAHLSDYDLLVQPSNYEGFGLTVVEAMAAKVPVLVSNVDGPMEIIQSGKYGFYFEKGNVEDCANNIDNIMHANNLNSHINDAYLYAKENFSIGSTAKNYWALYTRLLSNKL